MKEKQTAKAYALALMGLDANVADELTLLTEVINSSNNLENVLFLGAFTTEEKTQVFSDLSQKLKLSALVRHFILFLIQEKRLGLFPLTFKEIIVLDDEKKGFMRGTIEGQEEVPSTELIEKMATYLKQKTSLTAKLNYKKSNSITAGYRVTFGDLQIDATLENQLERFKKTILK